MRYTPYSALAFAAAASAQFSVQTCPSGVIVAPTAVEYPVYISTYITANTVFNINGNANITINNAPTTYETMTTATSTVFDTVTVTATTTAVPAPTATTLAEPILLGINAPVAKNKRQTAFSGFLGASAGIAATCQTAEAFSLIGGQFFIAGTSTEFSTTPGAVPVGFAASDVVGPITTIFGLSPEGFVWQNVDFVTGQALFCMSSAGTVEASFSGEYPADCTAITLTAIPASSCPGFNATASASVTSVSSSASITTPGLSVSSVASSSSVNLTSVAASLSSEAASLSSEAASLSSVASSLSSVNATVTVSLTSSSASISASGTAVQLTFPNPTAGAKKRQAITEYVTNEGTFSSDQTQAATFLLLNGQLFSNGVPFSTDPTTPYEVFIAGDDGTILTTFDVTGGFSWTNSSFTINTANTAEFAVSAGTIFAAFATIPPGAIGVNVEAIPATTSGSSSSSSSSNAATVTSGSGAGASSSSSTASGASATATATSSSSSSSATSTSSSLSSSITSSSSSSSVGNLSTGLSATTTNGLAKKYNIPYENVRHHV